MAHPVPVPLYRYWPSVNSVYTKTTPCLASLGVIPFPAKPMTPKTMLNNPITIHTVATILFFLILFISILLLHDDSHDISIQLQYSYPGSPGLPAESLLLISHSTPAAVNTWLLESVFESVYR